MQKSKAIINIHPLIFEIKRHKSSARSNLLFVGYNEIISENTTDSWSFQVLFVCHFCSSSQEAYYTKKKLFTQHLYKVLQKGETVELWDILLHTDSNLWFWSNNPKISRKTHVFRSTHIFSVKLLIFQSWLWNLFISMCWRPFCVLLNLTAAPCIKCKCDN